MKRSLTGDRPTGKLHLGHYVGSLKNRLQLQNEGYEQYVMIADVQALSAYAGDPARVRENVLEVALDYLAVGLDPKKTTIFVQSCIPHIAELTMYFLNLVTVSRLSQNPTVKTEIKEKGFEKSVPAGFFMHPVSQAADILIVRPDVVPVGEDQLPMIEQTNEICDKFNSTYQKTFKKVKALVSETPRLPGLDGKAKMSKSLGNAIFLSDPEKEIRKKVRSMYTDPSHIHAEDPGKVEGNTVFAYLDAFDSDTKEVARLKKEYTKGGLGDIALKDRLADVLEQELGPIRKRREMLAEDPEAVMDMLREGNGKVERTAEETMCMVREAMHIDYF